MNKSNRHTNEGVEDSAQPTTHSLGSTACRDIHRDLTDLSSQVQMMSDSLAACKQMSKGRPLRKMYSVKGNPRADMGAPKVSSEERATDTRVDQDEHSVIVSYMMKGPNKNVSDESNYFQRKSYSSRCWSYNSAMEKSLELLKMSSKVQMYQPREVDSSRMVDIIQRELRELMEMSPPVALLAVALSDTIFHCKECDRCCEKISSSLPFILNRIQKLIKYITTKKQETYRWPNDYNYLRLRPSAQPHSHRLSGRLLAKLKRISPAWIEEQNSGLQIVLEVKPETPHRKLFDKAENCSVAQGDSLPNFPVVHLRESKSAPLIQVLLPNQDPILLLDEKYETLRLRELAYALRLVSTVCLSPLTLYFLPSLTAQNLIGTPKPQLHGKFPYRNPSQEHSVHTRKKILKGTPKSQSRVGEKTVRPSVSIQKRSDVKQSFSSKDLLARVPKIVREFLQEAEAEKMHDQRVRNLETGAKVLRELIAEVQKNQMELSKTLMEKGIYLQPIIKLTDPDILEKENDIIRKVADLHDPGSKRVSMEALQTAMDDLKHKCTLKNRMILNILKGLRSNIPNEWWEGMLGCVFDESKAIEDFDVEKVNEMVQQAASLPGNRGQQGSRLHGRVLKTEDRPTEEESNVKGSVGADVEEELEKRRKDDGVVAEEKVTSVCDLESFSEGNPENAIIADTSVRKLEKQVSVLNTENQRLKHEIEKLKYLLKNTLDDFKEKTISIVDSDQQPSQNLPGKTINLTIQIVDKDFHRINDPVTLSHTSTVHELEGRTVDPTIRWKDAHSSSDPGESEAKEGECRALFNNNCGSNNMGSVLRENTFEQSPRRLAVSTAQEVIRKSKPLPWVPSKYRISEISHESRAGPSRKPVDAGHLFQKPSVMELVDNQSPGMSASMSNERGLQTIPENDCSNPSGPSKSLSQTIQRLRTRVRSINKDVAVLKSKNDRIDKLLDKLMDDAFENSESFEQMENNFQSLKEQLG